jgi:hypothetical protein
MFAVLAHEDDGATALDVCHKPIAETYGPAYIFVELEKRRPCRR